MRILVAELTAEQFAREVRRMVPVPLGERALRSLFAHYLELRRWAARIDLVGPSAFEELFTRHYAESLAALPLLPQGGGVLVDLGSGAGFPGFVLAAARPDLESYLVEPRARRCAFLAAAARQAELVCHCLNARVEPRIPLGFPARIDVLTVRALKLPSRVWTALAGRLAPGGRVLTWAGPATEKLGPPLAATGGLKLPGSGREIVEYRLPEER